MKELDENASKVLLGFRRWAIQEHLGLEGGFSGRGSRRLAFVSGVFWPRFRGWKEQHFVNLECFPCHVRLSRRFWMLDSVEQIVVSCFYG